MLLQRALYFVISVITFFLGILILKEFKGIPFIRGFMGDVLVVILLYFLLKVLFVQLNKVKAAIIVFLFATFIELLQLFQFADLINAKGILRTAIGTHFDFWDILAYLLGVTIAYYIYFYIQLKSK